MVDRWLSGRVLMISGKICLPEQIYGRAEPGVTKRVLVKEYFFPGKRALFAGQRVNLGVVKFNLCNCHINNVGC